MKWVACLVFEGPTKNWGGFTRRPNNIWGTLRASDRPVSET